MLIKCVYFVLDKQGLIKLLYIIFYIFSIKQIRKNVVKKVIPNRINNYIDTYHTKINLIMLNIETGKTIQLIIYLDLILTFGNGCQKSSGILTGMLLIQSWLPWYSLLLTQVEL